MNVLSRLREQYRMRRTVRYVTCTLALGISLIAVFAVHQKGIAVSTTERILDCPVTGLVAHTHTSDCYDENGNLLCTLPELELHTHSDDCYADEQTLICGLEESDEHMHDETCYETKQVLTCGLDEITEEHEHNDACFKEVSVSTPQDTQEEAPIEAYPEQSFTHTFEDSDGNAVLTVDVVAPEGALPTGSKMVATWVSKSDVTDKQYDAINSALSNETSGSILDLQAVDITFYDSSGNAIEPLTDVNVSFTSDLNARQDDIYVVHMDDLTASEQKMLESGTEPNRTAQLQPVVTDSASDTKLTFESKNFSTYFLAVTSKETTMVSEGDAVNVTVSAGADAGLSQTAVLDVVDYSNNGTMLDSYMNQLSDTLDSEFQLLNLFDISIMDNDLEVEPNDGSTVNVIMQFSETLPDDVRVVHFGKTVEVLTSTSTDTIVSFDTDSFSVYGIVTLPDIDTTPDIEYQINADELNGNEFYLSVKKNGSQNEFYFMNKIADSNKIAKTSANNFGAASLWHFEKVEGTDNQFYLWTGLETNRMYMTMASNGYMSLTSEPETALTVEYYDSNANSYYIYYKVGNTKYGLNMRQGENGKGFSGWTGKDDGSRIYIIKKPVLDVDPLGLDGKSYGLINYTGGTSGAALMNESQSASRLVAKKTLIRDNPLTSDVLHVANDTDISFWTFHALDSGKYTITTVKDGVVKYLRISNSDLTLVDTPDEWCTFSVNTNPTKYSNRIRISNSSDYSINLNNGSVSNGFKSYNDGKQNEWLMLAELSELTEEDFVLYSAHKVSVSDRANVTDGSDVVIYTRVWNESTMKYDIFAIDHLGNLVPAYGSGDVIQWVGLRVNNMLWNFTEYTDAQTGLTNDYYELQNNYSGRYLAPSNGNGELLSLVPVGVSLEGRRLGEYYTSVLAWDDLHYSYVGYKVENGKLVTCPLAEADSFYFATVTYQEAPELTTVDTVDNDDYGIVMRMIDFNNKVVSNRDSVQNPFFGGDNNVTGLLSTWLGANGYPDTTNKTGQVQSLSNLFTDMTDVNHLFIQSTYNESGYFEYDSTQNFATLIDENGSITDTFTVYDQLAAIGTSSGPTRTHGQFMPYNVITQGRYAAYTNQTNVLAQQLSDLDPRKGEPLYLIRQNEADYFFGMEMEASFTQTSDGLDAWGHDIIFEFSGDDDFWLYVDDVLVLDLGGVHSAQAGTINFKTGIVTSSRGNTTLRNVFKAAYLEQNNGSDADAEAWLDTVFKPGTSVFQDYTTHTMRMFYMERGAGASNLHMKFNLASVRKGAFLLSKKLSGTDSETNNLLEYPYQIYYRLEGEDEYRLLGANISDRKNVRYKDSTRTVTYRESFTPSGGTVAYDNVFLLKPGETAEVLLPEGAVDYYTVECGVNPVIYDIVTVNGNVIEGVDTENTVGGVARKDYVIESDTLEHRNSVSYDNRVREGASGSLTFTKKLYDSDGETELSALDDSQTFSFRLYLGDEKDSLTDIPLARFYDYYVKNENGEYCRWDAINQKFVSLGVTTHDALVQYFETNHWTAAQKESVIFKTSMYGSISKIPVGYTVEVRDLIAGTKYKIEERDTEIPRGYTRRISDGYSVIEHVGNLDVAVPNYNEDAGDCEPVSGIIGINDNPEVQIRNQKGWGLTVKKVWTDKDFMVSHDDIYFGVYLNDELVDGTLRAYHDTDKELYYFLTDLKDNNNVTHTFSEYEIREVTLENPVVDADGYVTSYDSISVHNTGDSIEVGGVAVGANDTHSDYTYAVNYEKGEQTLQNENIRVDTITNSRPGIAFYKSDFDGNVVAGAVFTLKTLDGENVSEDTYVADETGLITIAYLDEGTYVLRELAAPDGYTILDEPLTLHVSNTDNGQRVTVEGIDSRYYTISEDEAGMSVVIHIKNTPSTLQVKKIDGDTGEPLEGVHFSLYRQVTDNQGHGIKDYYPIEGYEDLVSDVNGIIPELTLDNLGIGTYYLVETQTLPGYALLKHDVCIKIGNDGIVSVMTPDYSDWVEQSEDDSGNVSYLIQIQNSESIHNVRFKKVSVANPLNSALSGAVFDLKQVTDDGVKVVFTGGISDSNGFVTYDGMTSFDLEEGQYQLIETTAPLGYDKLSQPVNITIARDGIVYDDTTSMSHDGSGIIFEDDTYTLLINNKLSVELPATGGHGASGYVACGIFLILFAIGFAMRKMRRICVA